MALEQQPLVINSSPVVEYYGSWPTFHDARVVSVMITCGYDTQTVTVQFVLNDMRYGDDRDHYANITMQWDEVEYLSLTGGEDTDADNGYWYWGENWLSEIKISADGKLIRTEMVAATTWLRGVILANRVQVVHFEPLGLEKEINGNADRAEA